MELGFEGKGGEETVEEGERGRGIVPLVVEPWRVVVVWPRRYLFVGPFVID